MHRLLLACLVVLALALAACGSDDDSGSSSSSSSTGTMTMTDDALRGNDVDKAFVRQMVPHHEGAVEMAELALEQSTRKEIKDGLAPAIIEAQEGEIETLEGVAAQLEVTPDDHGSHGSSGGHGSSSSMEDDAKTLGLDMSEMGMDMDTAELDGAKPFDKAFIDMMIPHHQGAIAMAKAQLAEGENPELRKLAEAIVAAQEREIAQMERWRADWYG